MKVKSMFAPFQSPMRGDIVTSNTFIVISITGAAVAFIVGFVLLGLYCG